MSVVFEDNAIIICVNHIIIIYLKLQVRVVIFIKCKFASFFCAIILQIKFAIENYMHASRYLCIVHAKQFVKWA